jgi:hypothetical protein
LADPQGIALSGLCTPRGNELPRTHLHASAVSLATRKRNVWDDNYEKGFETSEQDCSEKIHKA